MFLHYVTFYIAAGCFKYRRMLTIATQNLSFGSLARGAIVGAGRTASSNLNGCHIIVPKRVFRFRSAGIRMVIHS